MDEGRTREEIVNQLKEVFFGCCSLEGIYGDTAYIILSDNNEQLNDIMIDCVPEFMEKKQYHKVIFLCDKDYLNDKYECKRISVGTRKTTLALQRAFHPFQNIYVNFSEGYDDNDFLCFVGRDDIDLKYIVRNVFFDIPHSSSHLKKRNKHFDSEKIWNGINDKIKVFTESYDRIRERFPTGKLIVHPFVSGDMYMSCLYLKDYIDKKHIKDYEVLVSNKGAQKVGELFGIPSHIVEKEDLINAVFYQRVFGEENANIKNTHMYVGSQRGSIFLPIIDFNTHEQKWVYQCDERKTHPRLLQRSSDSVFAEHNLSPQKTILISPVAHSVREVNEEFYNVIIKNLKSKGYTICTNIVGEEKALPGTIGIFLTYDIVIDFVNKSAGFIGMRSGLCDIISTTRSKMVVLYRKDSFLQFSLKEMGLKTENIMELCAEDIIDQKEITRMIIDFLS